jgi:general secretion pathway protein L
VSLAGLRRALGASAAVGSTALHWWLAELASMVPASITSPLFGEGAVLHLRLDGDLLHAEASPPIDRAAPALPAPLAARVRMADAVILVLPASIVLRRTIDLPTAAARELASAVPFLVERHTPFLSGQARTAWRVAGRAAAPGRIQVELAATASAPLEQVLARLHDLRVPITAVYVEGDDFLPRLDFSRTRAGRTIGSWLAEPWRPLLAAAAALLLAGPLLVAGVVHERARRMEQGFAGGGAHLQARAIQRARLRAELALAATLAAREHAPDALAALALVTQALPDSSWLFSFDFTPQSLQLGGFSTDMPAAVARLQALPGVAKLEFRSPVIHDARADRDRFDILLRLQKANDAPGISTQPDGGASAAAGRDVVGLGARLGAGTDERGGGPR